MNETNGIWTDRNGFEAAMILEDRARRAEYRVAFLEGAMKVVEGQLVAALQTALDNKRALQSARGEAGDLRDLIDALSMAPGLPADLKARIDALMESPDDEHDEPHPVTLRDVGARR